MSQSEPEQSVQTVTTLGLKYQQEIVQELISEDALAVLGHGLGLERIVANLLYITCASTFSLKANKRSLIFLINASEFENFKLGETLMELAWSDSSKSAAPFTVIGGGDATTADKRRSVYSKGGIVSLSNRILVTDFLAEVIDPDKVTGLVILHAENTTDYSNDRFVINLYRRKNHWGFIKAFSEAPERICTGFQPLYTKLKILKLQTALLWPRFHVDVSSSLHTGRRDNTVTEVRVHLSSYSEKIENALMACIEALIGELRRNNPEVASEYWSMENALDESFVQRIRAMLEPVWHRVSYTTRQIVFDLGTLKSLLKHLTEKDCIEFYEELSMIVDANKPSVTRSNKSTATWLMLDESMAIIACAKARIFDKVKNSEEATLGESTYLLEEQPKWEQLSTILDDINSEKMAKDPDLQGPTLIMCSDYHTCRQLRHYLEFRKEYTSSDGQKIVSGRKLMIHQLKNYLAFKGTVGQASLKIQRDLNEVEKRNKEESGEISRTNPDDENSGSADKLNISRTFLRGRQPASKRRRTRGGAIIEAHDRLLNKDIGNDKEGAVDEAMVLKLESQMAANNKYDSDSDSGDDDESSDLEITGSQTRDDPADEFLREFDDSTQAPAKSAICFQYLDRSDQLIIEQFDTKSDSLLLDELMPSHIILYEPNLTFIRKVEQYQALRKGSKKARCFFMYYGGSVEEQKYLNDIKREKDAFTKLIREKANMPKLFETDEDEAAKFAPEVHVDTRNAGGDVGALSKTKIIVDMREFRSHLPFLCHLSGLDVIPCMLTVGDYILSPKICVERKSVPDLIGSLKNGRLYQQCEQMFRYYELPTLLIEFEEGKSFSLQPFGTYRNGVLMKSSGGESSFSQKDLQLKLMVLLTAYPSLRIFWTSSPFETGKLFRELKMNQDEPDVPTAVSKGQNPLFDKNSFFNDTVIDLIQNIPGIDSVNYTLVISKVKNLYELSQMSVDELAKLIGHEAANKVVNFFRRKV